MENFKLGDFVVFKYVYTTKLIRPNKTTNSKVSTIQIGIISEIFKDCVKINMLCVRWKNGKEDIGLTALNCIKKKDIFISENSTYSMIDHKICKRQLDITTQNNTYLYNHWDSTKYIISISNTRDELNIQQI